MCSKENLSVWICFQWRVSGQNSQSLVIFGCLVEMFATQLYNPTDVAKLMKLNIVEHLNGITIQCINALQVCHLRAQDSKEFGWNINGEITFDWKRLVANKVSTLSEQVFLLSFVTGV